MPPSLPLDPRTTRILPWIVAVAFFMQTLDGTILNTALPAMAASLEESPLRMQSAVIAYMLTVAMLIPASGWLADRFGARRVFITAIALFGLGSLLCALSQSLPQLVMARVLQATGGALMMPVGRLIILRNYPRGELVRIMGFVTIPGLMGPLIGPAVGGWLVEYASWHWIFLINIPVGALGILAALRFLPDLRQTDAGRFDWVGFGLVAAAMLLLSLALEGVGGMQLAHAKVTLLLLAGLASMAAYWLHAARTPAPLFALSLFRIHSFSVGVVGNLFTRLGSGAIPFLTPLLLQVGLGYSPAEAGMAMIPIAVAAMAAKAAATSLLRWFGYRRLLVVNTLLLGVLVAGFGLIGSATSSIWLYAYLALFGAVNSIQLTAMNTLTVIDLEGPSLSSGNSLVSVNMQLSMSLGIAMAAALLGGFVDLQHLADTRGVLAGFRWTYLCLGLATILAAGIFLQLRPDAGQGRKASTEVPLTAPPAE
jgi:EmrB/QacA subfamily drug resistance transporter